MREASSTAASSRCTCGSSADRIPWISVLLASEPVETPCCPPVINSELGATLPTHGSALDPTAAAAAAAAAAVVSS